MLRLVGPQVECLFDLALPVEVPPWIPLACAFTSCFTVFVGCAPRATQCWKRSSSITIVEGSVCGL